MLDDGRKSGLQMRAVAAVMVGCALTLSLAGYRFGTSNHAVYLLDALHKVHPELLSRDWFTTQTLQYHAVFGWITEWMLRGGWIEPGFLVGYLLLVVLMHIAWFRIVRHLGGDAVTYLMSVIFFELSGAGTALGSYQFLQDGAFLPSNIASVAMLWGIALGWEGRIIASGMAMGIAALMHLNYSLVAPIVLVFVNAPPFRGTGVSPVIIDLHGRDARATMIATLLLAVANIGLAIHGGLIAHGHALPLSEFVQLYVKLRHPHHYDPASWPVLLWLSFLWPIPFAAITLRKHRDAMLFLKLLGALTCFALLFAGVFFVSETLVQLSLFRFTIYIKLLTCIGAAIWMRERRIAQFFQLFFIVMLAAGLWLFFFARFPAEQARFIGEQLPAVMIFSMFVAIAAAVIFWRKPTVQILSMGAVVMQLFTCWPMLGLRVIPGDDAEYVEMCDWAAANTPADAIFLVPPGEQSMRWRGQRAIVVNFKGIPQLSRELPEWKRRMSDVLGEDTLLLPHGFARSLAAADAIYESRPKEQLIGVAKAYGARYVLVDHPWPETYEAHASSGKKYFLYDLARVGSAVRTE
jgi:hypothetical protein